MSRLGKIPVPVPKDVKVNINKTSVNVEGKKGKLSLNIPQGVTIEHKDDELIVSRVNDARQSRANHGTVRSLLMNMIKGVSEGHVRELEIHGVGFRGQAQGQKLNLNLGFSHPVEFEVPNGISLFVEKQTEIRLEGPDKEMLGLVASKIRGLKKPEPYKGKGIRYKGEFIRRKQGKSVKK